MKKVIFLAILLSIIQLGLSFYNNQALTMNPDERMNYQIALNHVNGHGYSLYDASKHIFVNNAFHPTFPVYTYEFLIKNKISTKDWVIFVTLLSSILFGCSIIYFYKLNLYFLNERYSFFSTIIYGIYLSVIYYIGSLFLYENISLYLIIICSFFMIKSVKSPINIFESMAVIISVLVPILYRPQTIAVFTLMLFSYSIILVVHKKTHYLFMVFIIVALSILINIPILVKNHNIFGSYILSTEFGYRLLQGYNPVARGSWMGSAETDVNNPLYIYVHKNIPKLDILNDYENSIAREKLAFDWIKENPIRALELDARKLAIYFLPFNYEVLPGNHFFNPINFLVYFLFLSMIFLKTVTRKWDDTDLIVLAPIAGSIALTLVFFMGARWRYYAEPFMIIYAVMFIKSTVEHFLNKRHLVTENIV